MDDRGVGTKDLEGQKRTSKEGQVAKGDKEKEGSKERQGTVR